MHWNRAKFLTITPAACFFGALALLVLPLEWLLSMLIAAAFHELFHYLAIRLSGGELTGLQIEAGGIIMDIAPLNRGKELICTLAGPLGSFLLILFIRWIPLIGICAAIQGVFNLLPLYPLDGGRALRCSLELWMPKHADDIFCGIEWITLAVIIAAGCYATLRLRLGLLPFLIALMLAFKVLSRKRPCKDCRLGVQ